MKLTIKFYLVLILFILLFIAAFFTKDAIQTNLIATSPLTLAKPCAEHCKPRVKNSSPFAHLRSHIPAHTSLLSNACSPLRNTAQNPANPASKIIPASPSLLVPASPLAPYPFNPSSHQIIVFRINLNNKDLSSITPHEYPREQPHHLEKPKSYQNAN